MVVDIPERPLRPRRRVHWLDLVVSFSALFISAVSIFITYQTSNSMERLVRASSWPFVQLGSGNTSDGGDSAISFSLQNAGTGPARIHSYAVVVDGRPVEGPNLFGGIARACCDAEYQRLVAVNPRNPWQPIGSVLTRPVAPGLLAPNEEGASFQWARTAENEQLWRAMDMARQQGRITTQACYCSVFDECWDVESNKLPVAREDVCAEEARQTLLPREGRRWRAAPDEGAARRLHSSGEAPPHPIRLRSARLDRPLPLAGERCDPRTIRPRFIFQLPAHVGASGFAAFGFVEIGAECARTFELALQETPTPRGERLIVDERILRADAGGVAAIELPRLAQDRDVHVEEERPVARRFALLVMLGHLHNMRDAFGQGRIVP